jgi:leucyl aminopeptidase
MKLNVAAQSASPSAETLVLLCTSRETKTKGVSQPTLLTAKAPVSAKEVLNSLPADRFKGEEGDILFSRQKTAPHFLFVGVGDTKKLTAETLRKLSPAILNVLKGEKIKTARIFASGMTADVGVVGFTEGLVMSNYQFTTFKEPPKNKFLVENIEIAVEKFSTTLKKTLEQSQILAESINFARWLGDCPGNFMTPTQLGLEAEKIAKGTKMKVVVWDKKRIEKEKMGSFLGVSHGSTQEPKFITMEYRGGPASQKPICYVGKGLTFDSGGISLKPGAGMEEMKFDMCGGANVIATMAAIAKMGLKINAIAYVPTTENMPGPAANKPGDICKARNGKTIEVNNTDAEGRLILADALVYACEQKPAMILDTATLTGAMMIALGNTHTGFFTRNDALSKKVEAAAAATGERVWRMPLIDDHAKDMKGYYADLTNLAPSRNAGSSTATAFLESFVVKDIPWAHFDIAGTGWNVGNRLPYLAGKGASGAIVRTFVEMAKSFKA